MKILHIATAVAVAVLITGCCACKKYQKKYGKPLETTEWTLVQVEGKSFDAGDKYQVVFGKDNRISGIGDCNRLTGSYTADDNGKMKISQIASTRMMCPDQTMENKFFDILQQIDTYQLDGKMLLLLRDGELVAVFEAK